jgi:hypothetical protein
VAGRLLKQPPILQEMLKMDYEQRQKMMRELESIKTKENELRREKDLQIKEQRLTEDRLREREAAIQARVDEAHRIVDQMRKKYEEDLET